VSTPIPDQTRRRWQADGNKSQRVALLISQWAQSQQPHAIIPADDVLISRYPRVDDRHGMPSPVRPDTIHHAIRHLADLHILYRDRDTGHYHVAATQPPAQAT
jgi:hypothetical protein